MPPEHDPSFVALFVKNQRRIYGYILTVVPDCNEADDLFQQTSMVLWEKASEFRADGDFVRWGCGIAHNLIRNWRVKRGRDRHCFSDAMMDRIAAVRATKSEWLDSALAALGLARTNCRRPTANCSTHATRARNPSGRSAPNLAEPKGRCISICTASAQNCWIA